MFLERALVFPARDLRSRSVRLDTWSVRLDYFVREIGRPECAIGLKWMKVGHFGT